jgi:hypothetical protein
VANKRMGEGQNLKLKADYGRDKSYNPGPEEKREVSRRQGSSKKMKSEKKR